MSMLEEEFGEEVFFLNFGMLSILGYLGEVYKNLIIVFL